MEINLNYWDWGGGAARAGMEENERQNAPLISVKTDPRPADSVSAVANSRGSELTSVREPEDSCSVIPLHQATAHFIR